MKRYEVTLIKMDSGVILVDANSIREAIQFVEGLDSIDNIEEYFDDVPEINNNWIIDKVQECRYDDENA